MAEVKTASRNKVPLGQKAAFGAGHLINNLIPMIKKKFPYNGKEVVIQMDNCYLQMK